ncbi:MAG: hypothetical protein LC623_00845 [Halobacteriales archaeon]|nr:hypothetical protein [Halobacteriales archaeon]
MALGRALLAANWSAKPVCPGEGQSSYLDGPNGARITEQSAMSKCFRFGQKGSRAGAIVAVALVSSILLPASADPLPPELDPVQQIIARTLDYAQNFDPTANATEQYQQSQGFIGSVQDIIQQTLCISFHIGQTTLYIGQIDPQSMQLNIEVPGVGWDHGYFGQGTYRFTSAGSGGIGCAVPVDNAPPIEYNSTLLDRWL